MLVSLVIPTINQVELVENCVESLLNSLAEKEYDLEVIVVDDGSPPRIQQELRAALAAKPVRLFCKSGNTGFAATVNQGAALAGGEYICLVNNDVTFPNDSWFDHLVKAAKLYNAGVVGACLLYPNGLIQHAGVYYLPRLRTFDHEGRFQPLTAKTATGPKEALAVTGALMLVESGVWQELGGMDENFFIALEDVDFSLRAWEKGRRVIYQGASVAVHHEGLTRGNTPMNKNPYWFAREQQGIEYFFAKWGPKLSRLERLYQKDRRSLQKGASPTQTQAMIWQSLAGRERA